MARLEQAAQVGAGEFLPLASYNWLVGVNQQWNTFAPVPPDTYSTHSVLADFEGEERPVWEDGLDLERAGVGLFYNPVVKVVGGFRGRLVQEIVLRSLAKRLRRAGLSPRSLSLQVSYKKMEVGANGHVSKSGPNHLRLRTLWIASP